MKDAVDIPVIANGDIVDSATAGQAMQQSGADGVMIGRGTQGRPWLLAQVAHDLYGTPAPVVPKGRALVTMAQEHYEAMQSFYGTVLGPRVARKHMGWYMDTVRTPAGLRRALLTCTEGAAMPRLIEEALGASESLPA